MIESINIKNFAIIKNISVEFSKGLNVFSGETGAGKSIIVESLAFLFGSKYYGTEIKEPVEVSARVRFDKDTALLLKVDERIEIKRVYSKDKKNKYYINSKPVNSSYISDISKYVIDFHSQMNNSILTSSLWQTEMLDSYAGIKKEAGDFFKLYCRKNEIEAKINTILMSESEKKRLLDLYEYQLREIEEANLRENEDFELEEIISRAKNITKVKNICSDIISKINDDGGVYDLVLKISKKSEDLLLIDEQFKNILDGARRIEMDVKDFLEEVSSISSNYNFTEEDVDNYIKRDELIKSLKKKYLTDLKGVILKKQELKKKIDEIYLANDNVEILKKELNSVIDKMNEIAKLLGKKRRFFAKELSNEIKQELKKLGFEHCIFEISVEDLDDFNQYGKNLVEFLFSSNPDYAVKPIRYVASGGEISRLMLALKSISADDKSSKTFIFDEIDSGVGGNTAFFVGEALKKLSMSNQILSITHMPQVAVFSDLHFKVEKKYENNETLVLLTELKSVDDRIDEISRMLGSVYSPDTARKHAKELIKKATSKL